MSEDTMPYIHDSGERQKFETGADWEQLSVSATPTADGEIQLFLTARDAGTFADLTTNLAGADNDL